MKNLQAINNQTGSALLICLVLLTVLTLVGISSMNNSLLEEKMATNTQFKTVAFQTAKSEIETQFISLGDNSLPIVNSIDADISLISITSPAQMSIDSDLVYIGEYERKARSKDQIQSIGAAKVIVTELTVTSTMPSSGATSQQTLGTELPSPSS